MKTLSALVLAVVLALAPSVASATEIVGLGYNGGIVIVADKRTSRTDGSIIGDTETKIHPVPGKSTVFALAGVQSASEKVQDKSTGALQELALIDSKMIETYLSSNQVDPSNKPSVLAFASFVRDVYDPLLANNPQLADVGLQMIVINYDTSSTTPRANGVVLSTTRDGIIPRPLHGTFRGDRQFFRCRFGAASPLYDTTLKISTELPASADDAIKLAALEILRTHEAQKTTGNVGPTFDACVLDNKGFRWACQNTKLADVASKDAGNRNVATTIATTTPEPISFATKAAWTVLGGTIFGLLYRFFPQRRKTPHGSEKEKPVEKSDGKPTEKKPPRKSTKRRKRRKQHR